MAALYPLPIIMYSNALADLVHALVLSPQTRIIVPSALLYVFPQTLHISFETSFVQHGHYYTLGDVSICDMHDSVSIIIMFMYTEEIKIKIVRVIIMAYP